MKRPLIDIEFQDTKEREWHKVSDVLVDTGADITMIPSHIGETLVGDPRSGVRGKIKGVVPGARLTVYIHTLKLRFNGHEFESPVLISERDDVFPILGRTGAIDRFLAEFDRGEELRMSAVKRV